MPTHPSELEFKNFTTSQVHKRILQGSKRRDLYSWLLAEDGDHSKYVLAPILLYATADFQAFRRKMSQIQLNSDAILIVVAGSDTTSSGTAPLSTKTPGLTDFTVTRAVSFDVGLVLSGHQPSILQKTSRRNRY